MWLYQHEGETPSFRQQAKSCRRRTLETQSNLSDNGESETGKGCQNLLFSSGLVYLSSYVNTICLLNLSRVSEPQTHSADMMGVLEDGEFISAKFK